MIEDNITELLMLHLKQKQGFLNKMYYESSITVNEAYQKESEYPNSQLVINDGNDENSNFTYSFDNNRKIFSIENKCVSNCNECKLRITFQFPYNHSVSNPIKIATDTNLLLASEYVKISNKMSEYVYGADRPHIDFDVKTNKESIDKFHISNCPVIKIKESFWASTAGPFPCGDNSNCIIYYSLNEKELSKSPITLSLYERNLYEKNDNEFPHLADERKFWIVRKAIMGG